MPDTGTPPAAGTPSSAQEPEARLLLGRYRIQATVGTGRYSTVYRAHDAKLGGRRVAAKISHPDAASVDHLLQEARVLAGLDHPATPRLLDVGRAHGRVALIMEYLPAQSLAQTIAARPATEGEALDWAVRLCDVLIHLHGRPRPVAHGAISPDHCLLLASGRLVLIDFGTASDTREGRGRADTLAVPRLLAHLLTKSEAAPAHGEVPRWDLPALSPVIVETLQWALHPAAEDMVLTLGTFRRRLQECRHALGLRAGICPYCQAVARADARYCTTCGSPVGHNRVLKPVTALPLPALGPGAGTLLATHTSYQARLRALGRFLDRQGLRAVTLRDGSDSFIVRGTSSAEAPHAHPEGVTLQVPHRDLDRATSDKHQEAHDSEARAMVIRARVTPASPYFPTGYEDGLRALGYQLDRRGGVDGLIIAEGEEGLALEYTLVGSAHDTPATRHRLLLSSADMEAAIAEAVDRRGAD